MKWRDSGTKYLFSAPSAQRREQRVPARWVRFASITVAAFGFLLGIESTAFAAKARQNTAVLPRANEGGRGLFLEVRLPKQLKFPLKQGDMVDGTLAQSVYDASAMKPT